jgi:GNAT superfamily N-acetyltransferase
MNTPYFALRTGRETDLPFVLESWASSIKNSTPRGTLGAGQFWSNTKNALREVLAREGVQLQLAHVPEDDDALLGFAVSDPLKRVVHFVYVKKSARRLGIARALLALFQPPDLVTYTHRAVTHGLRIPSHFVFRPEARATESKGTEAA